MTKNSLEKKLTRKQLMFIEEYLVDFNATKAAIRARYSKKSAYAIGAENLRKPIISEEISIRLKEKALNPEGIVYRLSEIANVTMEDFFDFHGSLPMFNPDKAKERGVFHLIESIEYSPDKGIKLKFSDRLKALEMIGRYHGIWKERHEVTGADGKDLLGALLSALNTTDTNDRD